MKKRQFDFRLIVTISIIAILTVVSQTPLQARPVYNITTLGITDYNHTNLSGYHYSYVRQLNERGQVIGWSNRYNNGDGATAWLYYGENYTRLDFTDSIHLGLNGKRSSSVLGLNDAGQVIGCSDRYYGYSNVLGTSAWLYDGASFIMIGFYDADHTGDQTEDYERQYSRPKQINEAGQVIGDSRRYVGSFHSGEKAYSPWLYDGGNYTRLGFTDDEHTGDDGKQNGGVRQINEAGQVIGASSRYNGYDEYGTTAWLYDGENYTIIIGLTDAEHTREDGAHESSAGQINEAGQVTGNSECYNG